MLTGLCSDRAGVPSSNGQVSQSAILRTAGTFLFLLWAASASLATLAAAAGSDPLAPDQPLGPMKVAITVDDMPEHGDPIPGLSREDIAARVLRTLADNDIKQAFGFVNGYGIDYTPGEINILKEWLNAGYPLGNHTNDHPHLDEMSARAYTANIEKLDRLLATLAPVSPLVTKRKTFRYPFLEEGDTLRKRNAVRRYLRKNGYRIAEVTIDYNDWAWNDAYIRCVRKHDDKSIAWLKAHIVDNAERHLRESRNVASLLFGMDIAHILLIHAGAFDAVMLDTILKDLRAKGVTFITLDQALEDPVYRINPNLAFKGGQTFLEQIGEARKIDYERFRESTYTVDKIAGVCPETRAPK